MTEALAKISCGESELISSRRPSDYPVNLRLAVNHHSDLVVAGSFLLTDAVADAARAYPSTHFVLVDPIVLPASLPNLVSVTFRQDQAAFLAGALAAMLTQSGVVAGVYGPEGIADQQQRAGFEHGARYIRPSIQVLGAYQPALVGEPYANPAWGAAQAGTFIGQHADVLFGAGGTTGQGALGEAARSGRLCIGIDSDAAFAPAKPCLVATSQKRIDLGVAAVLFDIAQGHWTPGVIALGLDQRAVGLNPLSAAVVTPKLEQRLQTIAQLLAAGLLMSGPSN